MVTVKLAIDANGSVDDRSEEAQRFTSEACLDEVHRLRMDCDAILVGAETIERDNPSLTVRRLETERQPLRVILDPKERTNQEATVYTDGYDTIQVGADYNGLLPLLNRLGDMEKQRLLIEGGPKTIHSFLSEELVDEFYLVQSNVVHHEPVPSNIDAQRLTQSGLTLDHTETWGKETVQVWIRTPSQ
jgi:diaminohydroxyphosphoribosylaminopyrimidine deaminase/5-amino-6-(5-phosphoribosylamino)uracil reductase